VVVNEEVQETNKTTPRSEWGSLLKKDLTGPTWLEMERYKRLLLAKLDELSVTRTEAESPMLAAGGLEGDLLEQANADAEAELQLRLHKSDAHLLRAVEEALARIRRSTFSACEVRQQSW